MERGASHLGSGLRRVSIARALALIGVAVVLVAFGLTEQIAQRHRTASSVPVGAADTDRARAAQGGVDVDAAVHSVRNRVTAVGDGSGALAARDEQYRARFDALGVTVRLGDRSLGVLLRGARRGSAELPLSPEPWTGHANVARRAVRAGVTEHVTVRHGELEWDVVLEHAPPGSGDLQLEAQLRGLAGAPVRIADPPGWSLPLGGGRAARMGEVVVKDASGAARYRSLPQLRGQRLRLVVPASALSGARYPLTIDPTVGPEQPIDSPGGSSQFAPAVAWDGTNFLVVWEDDRSDSSGDIYGARVSATGVVLDPAGIPIATAPNQQIAPAVVWDGTNFLVVWQDARSATIDVYGARVSAAGGVLDPAGIPISTAANNQIAPALAWDGSDFLVVWQGPLHVSGARVSGAGAVLDPSGIDISPTTGSQASPTLAWNGSEFLVVWQDLGADFDIAGARVTVAGAVLDPTGIPISTAIHDQKAPAVASWGHDFFVVWQDRRSGSWDIYGAGVSTGGTVQQPAGIPISTAD